MAKNQNKSEIRRKISISRNFYEDVAFLEENPVFLDVCLGLKLGAARPRKSFEKIKQNGRFSRPGAFEVEADLRLKIIQQTWRHL